MTTRGRPRATEPDAAPPDAARLAGDIGAYEASTGVAHAPAAILVALLLAAMIGPIVGALRSAVRWLETRRP